MAQITVTVTGVNPVNGYAPGESFKVDDTDPRLRMWERGGNVNRGDAPPKRGNVNRGDAPPKRKPRSRKKAGS